MDAGRISDRGLPQHAAGHDGRTRSAENPGLRLQHGPLRLEAREVLRRAPPLASAVREVEQVSLNQAFQDLTGFQNEFYEGGKSYAAALHGEQ